MIRHGFGLMEDEYFALSRDNLWVKSVWDKERGVIILCWQTRYRIVDGRVEYIDENGEVFDRERVGFARFDANPWNKVDTLKLDTPEFVEMARGRMKDVINAVMRHQCMMLALGFGDSAEDVGSWFECLTKRAYIGETSYWIENGCGDFHGCDGMKLHVHADEDDKISATLSVEGGESVELESIESEIDFLISTVPEAED